MHTKKYVIICLLALLFAACAENQTLDKVAADSIALNEAKVIRSFYSTPQKEEFTARCITCHSLRYIQMQPAFPRKTWEKIVDKMVKNFGASIPDSSAKLIVDYLMEIKGKE
jgi:hypothetical protein